ncbi:MAG: hypothetical protein ACFB12_02810 [Leptolyngbyaceae cyanobacterium]
MLKLKNYPDLVLALTFQEIAAGEGWGAIALLDVSPPEIVERNDSDHLRVTVA